MLFSSMTIIEGKKNISMCLCSNVFCTNHYKSQNLWCSGLKINNYMTKWINYNCYYVSAKYVPESCVLYMYLYVYVYCNCYLALVPLEKCTLWWQAPNIFVLSLFVPSHVTKVHEYDMHLWVDMVCIDMVYVLHISTVAYRVQWLPFFNYCQHHVSWHLFHFSNLWYLFDCKNFNCKMYWLFLTL